MEPRRWVSIGFVIGVATLALVGACLDDDQELSDVTQASSCGSGSGSGSGSATCFCPTPVGYYGSPYATGGQYDKLQILGDDFRVYWRSANLTTFGAVLTAAAPTSSKPLDFIPTNWDGSVSVLTANSHRWDYSPTAHHWTDAGIPITLPPGRTLIDMEWHPGQPFTYLDSAGTMYTSTGATVAPPAGPYIDLSIGYDSWTNAFYFHGSNYTTNRDDTYRNDNGVWTLVVSAGHSPQGSGPFEPTDLGSQIHAPNQWEGPLVALRGKTFYYQNLAPSLPEWDYLPSVADVALPCYWR